MLFALVVRFEIAPAHVAAFDKLMAQTVTAIRSEEPDTLVYVCCRVDGAATSRVFFEIYTDRAAFEAHEQTPATMRFLHERTAMIATSRVEFLEPYEWKIEAVGPPP